MCDAQLIIDIFVAFLAIVVGFIYGRRSCAENHDVNNGPGCLAEDRLLDVPDIIKPKNAVGQLENDVQVCPSWFDLVNPLHCCFGTFLLPVETVIQGIGFSVAYATSENLKSSRPDFSGDWVLENVLGDMETFLRDMGLNWLARSVIRIWHCGVGRVAIKCKRNDDDDWQFMKTLANPRSSESFIPVKVGRGYVNYMSDFGCVTAVSQWCGDALQFEGTLDESRLPVILRMFYNTEGKFVEEMVSYSGTTVRNIFVPMS